MLNALRLQGFRTFSSLTVNDLNLVNLFVGTNNCGKTSLLEAIEMLGIGASFRALVCSPRRRNERYVGRTQEKETRELEIIHLFNGHKMDVGSKFLIEGFDKASRQFLECEITQASKISESQRELFESDYETLPRLAASLRDAKRPSPLEIPLSASYGIPRNFRMPLMSENQEIKPVNFLTSQGFDSFEMRELWNSIALTDEEKEIIQTLRILEPNIDRIAFLGSEEYRFGTSTGGIFIKLKNTDIRLPLGCLGEGIRRLLGLSLGVIRSAGGFMMIDEIDTGLHHSIMQRMWQVLIETARRLNVQIFATTHSSDCIRSLGFLKEENPDLCDYVRLYRIEKGSEKTVGYTVDELNIATEQQVEIRGRQ